MNRPPLELSTGALLRVGENRFGSLEIQATDIKVLDRHGAPAEEFNRGDPIHVVIEYDAPNPVRAAVVGLTILDQYGKSVFTASTDSNGVSMRVVAGRGLVRFEITLGGVGPGTFSLDAGIYHHDWSYAYDHHSRVHSIRILENPGRAADSSARVLWRHEALPGIPNASVRQR